MIFIKVFSFSFCDINSNKNYNETIKSKSDKELNKNISSDDSIEKANDFEKFLKNKRKYLERLKRIRRWKKHKKDAIMLFFQNLSKFIRFSFYFLIGIFSIINVTERKEIPL